jgi:transcription elongation factor Elf1
MKKVFVIISILIVVFVFLFIDVENYRVGIADAATTPPQSNVAPIIQCGGTFGNWINSNGVPVTLNNIGTSTDKPSCDRSQSCGTLTRTYKPSSSTPDFSCDSQSIPNFSTYTCPPCASKSVNSCQLVKPIPDPTIVTANATASTIIGYTDPSLKVDSSTIANYTNAYKNYINAVSSCNTPASYDSANLQFVCPSTSPVATITNDGFVTCSP